MKVEEKGHTTILRDTANDPLEFLEKVTAAYKSYESKNLILDISHAKDIALADLKKFLPLSNAHRKLKKSFVLVTADIDFNAVPAKLVVVPSLLEAHDIIEMEEIERDLGF